MRALGAKGGNSTARKHGAAYMKQLGSLGGKETSRRMPRKWYSEIAHKGNVKLAEIIGAGKVVIE